MRTTGQFETHYYPIQFKKYGDPIRLVPFGDIHRSAALCHEEKWLEFLENEKRERNTFYIGMGDYDDLMSTSERASMRRAEMHDQTIAEIEQMQKRSIDRLTKEISFMRGRVIGLIEGNHYAEFINGTTSTQRMCDTLGCKYLGASAFIRLSLSCPTDPKRALAFDIWAHHGLGAARLVGGSFNRVQNMAEAAEADLYLMGHDHRRGALPLNRLQLKGQGDNIRLANRKVYVARTGSFMRGYVEGARSYVADGAMNPSDLGVVVFTLTVSNTIDRNRGGHTTEIDIKATV